MLIFLAVVLLVYGTVNGYIFWRLLQAFSSQPWLKAIFLLSFLVSMLSFPLGRIINSHFQRHFSEKLVSFGAYHLALMIYLLLLLLARDLLRGMVRLGRISPEAVSWLSVKQPAGFIFITAVSLLIIFLGHLNAINPKLKTLDLCIPKEAPAVGELKAVLVSDIHLGVINRSERLSRLVEKINALKPDVVFLAGDIVDEAVSREEEEKMVGCLKAIKAPHGVYACPGNHEYYGGFARNISYLEKAGVQILLDRAVRVGDCLYVIGRKDWTAVRQGETRLSLKEIISRDKVNLSWPVVVLDHQPLYLEEAASAGVDLQLSGHTHAGQLFPLNLINRLVYEKNWGYLRKNQTHFYVSSGSGTWGPPVRTGSHSELVVINLSFGQK
ncbi:MAG: metallophosphoesterase [Candidatus Aminicenantes bacterium]|nr:metallophosphoesterase [Candidatus Aminicenantes bacterium]